MRIFGSCLEAVKEVERDLYEMGVRVHPETMQDLDVRNNQDYMTLELSPYGFSIAAGCQTDAINFPKYFNIPEDWIRTEFDDRVSGQNLNPGNAWVHRKEVWAPFIHDGKFAYTYPERMHNQIDKVIEELKTRPGSRQVVLTFYNVEKDLKNWGGVARIPCSMHYQLLLRDNKLNLVYVMRSNDLLTFFGSDNFFAISFQRYIAGKLGVELGSYTFFTGSLHAYFKDLKARGIF